MPVRAKEAVFGLAGVGPQVVDTCTVAQEGFSIHLERMLESDAIVRNPTVSTVGKFDGPLVSLSEGSGGIVGKGLVVKARVRLVGPRTYISVRDRNHPCVLD